MEGTEIDDAKARTRGPRGSCPKMPARNAPGGRAGAGAGELRLPLWEELTSAEVGALAEEDPVAVLPLAAVEQHGPHLPLSTDIEIGRGILEAACARLPEGFPTRVLPIQSIGASAEHESYPGTLSLGPEHLIRTICRIGGAVRRAGVRRLVLFNSHGGNRAAMEKSRGPQAPAPVRAPRGPDQLLRRGSPGSGGDRRRRTPPRAARGNARDVDDGPPAS